MSAKINVSNRVKIEKRLSDVQKGCSARVINMEAIENSISEIEISLSGLLHKKNWVGLKFDVDFHACYLPNSYRWSADSTKFEVHRGTSGWFLSSIRRDALTIRMITPHNIKEKGREISEFVSDHKWWV